MNSRQPARQLGPNTDEISGFGLEILLSDQR